MNRKVYATEGAGRDLALVAALGMTVFEVYETQGPAALSGFKGVIIAGVEGNNDLPVPRP